MMMLLHMLQMIDFIECSTTLQIWHQKNGVDEPIFSSSPYFCGNKIFETQPVPLTFDGDTTAYKFLFKHNGKDTLQQSDLLLDYSTSM